VHLLRSLADWFWRIDALLGGGAEPQRGQRFSAAHPVRLGLILGSAFGGLIGVIMLVGAVAGAKNVFTLTSLFVCLGFAAFIGAFFVGLGYFERWRQRHYGHYPQDPQDE
jgi:hypothetical protein